MARKGVKKEIKEKIYSFAQKLRLQGFKIDSLILFGSHARGSAKPFSDIDICITSSKFGNDPIEEAAKLRLIADEVDWRIEPHPYKTSSLKMKENPFIYEIISTGIKLQ